MGGVAVANGSTLSATGEMQVSCNVPYVLSVDGVEWVPTASAGGVDTYLLSTSGVVRIFINGVRYFIFSNTVAHDFKFTRVGIEQYRDGEMVRATTWYSSYYQGHLLDATNVLRVYLDINNVVPAMSREDIVALGATSIQGEVTISAPDWAGDLVLALCRNFDKSQYNAVYVGNVLVAFIEPNS